MLTWYRINAKEYAYKKTLTDFRNSRVFLVTSSKGVLYTKINEVEIGWLRKIQKDFNFDLTEIQESDVPEYYTAPCGQMTTSHVHQARCKSCRQLKANVQRADRDGVDTSVKEVLKLPEIKEFNINGLLDLLKAKRDQAFELSEQLDSVIKSIEGVNNIAAQVNEIEAQKEQFQKGIELFMESN